MDVFEPGPEGLVQIHDFNPGIDESGLFWTEQIDPKSVSVNPGNGRASMSAEGIEIPDFHDVVNALLRGPSVPGVVSFHIEWTKSNDKQRFNFPPETWDANVVFNTATCAWNAETELASYVSDPASESASIFAEVGHERNGVYF